MTEPVQPTFTASDGWVHGFLWRHNLVLRSRTTTAQTLPPDVEEKVTRFWQDLRPNGDFSYDRIANMDETPIFFDTVPTNTIDKKVFTGLLILTSSGCNTEVQPSGITTMAVQSVNADL